MSLYTFIEDNKVCNISYWNKQGHASKLHDYCGIVENNWNILSLRKDIMGFRTKVTNLPLYVTTRLLTFVNLIKFNLN